MNTIMRRFNVYLTIILVLSASSCLAWGETKEQVAQRARSLLVDPNNFAVGTLSTTYPDDFPDPFLKNSIASGPEYFAPCFENGDLLMLAMPVSQNWRNAFNSQTKNATISISSSADPQIPDPRHTSHKNVGEWDPKRPTWRKGMPSKQRMTLFGHFEKISLDNNLKNLVTCYHSFHPDAKHWSPGSKESPHFVFWSRFIIDRIYRVGGFGDESNIGWIDLDLWQRSGSSTIQQKVNSDDVEIKNEHLLSPETLFGDDIQHLSRFYIQN